MICVSAPQPADHGVRAGRLGKSFIEQRLPAPTRELHHRVLYVTASPSTHPPRGRDRTKIAELFADERCSQEILDFLATIDVGRTAGPPVAEEGEGGASEASEWEDREQLREEEERLGGEE